jgi:hypothetical protein
VKSRADVRTKPNLRTGFVFFIRPLVIGRSLEAAVRRTGLSRIGESGRRTPCHPWMLRRNTDDGDRFGIGIAVSSHGSMSRPGRRGLQLDDSPSDPFPDGLPFEVASFELGPKVQTVAHRAACIRSARRSAASSASSPCCRISRLAAHQMSRSEIIGIVVDAHSHRLQLSGDRAH